MFLSFSVGALEYCRGIGESFLSWGWIFESLAFCLLDVF